MLIRNQVVAVTGSNGLVGSRAVARLVQRGAFVRALVRRPREVHIRPGVEEYAFNYLEDQKGLLKALQGVQCIVHAAYKVGNDLAASERINIQGMETLLSAALAVGVRRFVQVSTVEVYVKEGRNLIDETCPLRPFSKEDCPYLYAAIKAEAERKLHSFGDRGLPYCILRPGAILGVAPTSRFSVQHPERIRGGAYPLVTRRLYYVHVENFADALELAIESDGALGKAFNVVDGHVNSDDYVNEVRSWFGMPPYSGPRQFVWSGEFASKYITDVLGYRPRLSYQDGMREAKDYWDLASKLVPTE
jgi:nucleoside-diphosphate-sugar epimerase